MELRTTFNIEPSPDKITYSDPVMFIGSCFASSVGSQLELGRMPVMINPAGSVYNPVSVFNTLDTIISGKEIDRDDLYCHEGRWLSFFHYTDFTSEDPSEVDEKINRRTKEALAFLKSARFLFITLGTARVYRWKATGLIVSNCHKIPSSFFEPELLKADEIVALWNGGLSQLKSLFPGLKVVFTVSPVRHWKDGAHGNQVSKSVLFLAIEELLSHPISPKYFPAYELMMDDLRDYRFYDDDMLHPSDTAIKYIWHAFSDCYLDKATKIKWNEIVKITKACNHRFLNNSDNNVKNFARHMLDQIKAFELKSDLPDLSAERNYFLDLLK